MKHHIVRTTTDKLPHELDELDGDFIHLQYMGGRDWVIVTKRDEPVLSSFSGNTWMSAGTSTLVDVHQTASVLGRPVAVPS
jgi:hypothetical protein